MLYLHIGLPRTATTSVQRLLASASEALHARGYEYPVRWRAVNRDAHHQLAYELLDDDPASPAREELVAHLGRAESTNVIISSESFTNALAGPSFPRFRDFLAACSAASPVKVIIALRRLDAMTGSMYLRSLQVGAEPEPLDLYVERRFAWVDGLFANLVRLDDERWSVATVLYREGSDALGSVLRQMDLDPDAILAGGGPTRAVPTLGLKAQALLGSLDRLAPELADSRDGLVELLGSGEFEFEGELHRFDVLGSATREALHEHALAKAAEHGVRTYLDTFAGDRIAPVARTEVDPSVLSPEDVEALGQHLRADARVGDER